MTDQKQQGVKAPLLVEAGKIGGGETVGDQSTDLVPKDRDGVQDRSRGRPD